ncbi:MAG: MFS transporter [Azonexus sp.]|nr:MFS transporter [Azonexus sp.]MCK6413520.1 MFS transporter [Azonexus sp.]
MHALPYWRLSGYYFFYFAFLGAFSPFFGLYLQSIEFSAWDIGLLMSQMQLMRLLGPYVWGWLADRYGSQVPIIRLAALASGLGFISFFWWQRLPLMLVAMAVLAFFWSAALPLVESLTFDHLREERGRYSRIRLWGSIGFIVAVLATGALLDHVPASGVLWVCAAILLGILVCALGLPEVGSLPGGRAPVAVGEILRQPRVRFLLAACFAMSVAHGPFYVFFSIHLAEHGYDRSATGVLWSLGVLAEIAVFMAMARLGRRYSLRTILRVAFAAAVLRFLLMGWGMDSLALAVVVQLLHGLTFGAYHAAAITAINLWFPGSAQARGQALYSSLSFGAGGLLGALISGYTWSAWGAGWTFSLAALAALAGYALIAHGVPAEITVDAAKRQKSADPVQ